MSKVWELELYNPDTVEWNASELVNGDLYTTGNTWAGATEKVNIVTSKTDQYGSVTWETEYNGAESGFDYGAAIAIDGSGNVFVAGVAHESDDATFDIVVIKYNSSGVEQWATTFDGTGNDNDIASDILLLGTDIYVCAASIGSGSGYDYLLIKLNSSGTVQWNARYDYDDLYDIPGYLATNGSQVIVSGASQSTASDWDYCSLKYNSSGSLMQTNRTSAAGYGFDRPTGLVTDGSGNYYITGYAHNGTDYDIRTIKLDDDLSTEWTNTVDGGDEDGSNAICIDGSDNVYVAGFTETTDGNNIMKVIKYNSSGTQQWTNTFSNVDSLTNSEAMDIIYDSGSDKVIVTGRVILEDGDEYIRTFALNVSTGAITWSRDLTNINSAITKPRRVFSDDNNIWIYGTRIEDDTTKYIAVKYQQLDRSPEAVLDTNDVKRYVAQELIIRFFSNVMDDDFVNDTDLEFGKLGTAISSNAMDSISRFLCDGGGQCNPSVVKLTRWITKDDSIQTSRSGQTFKQPKVWSTLLVLLPDDIDLDAAIDSLESFHSVVMFAEKVYYYHSQEAPDDTEYSTQQSLESSTYANGNINIEPAWDVVEGSEDILIGVFDSGIRWSHEDLGGPTFASSKVVTGYNYILSSSAPESLTESDSERNDGNGHGTPIAGIIGALRYNNLGIAGIAGGDMHVGSPNRGVLFGSYVTADYYGDHDAVGLIEATYDACADGIDIGNYSVAGNLEAYNESLHQAFYNSYLFDITNVASRGNIKLADIDSEDDKKAIRYPACFRPDLVLNVGASGYDGELKTDENGDVSAVSGTVEVGDQTYFSMYGHGVDFIAPGTTETVFSTSCVSDDSYYVFNGTSASAPHVSGLAALIQEYYPDYLYPEDISNVISYSCNNIGSESTEKVGAGQIDAGETISNIEYPEYQVIHYSGTSSTYTSTTYASNVFINCDGCDVDGGISGVFRGDAVDFVFTFNHTIPGSASLLDGWSLSGHIDGFERVESFEDNWVYLPDKQGSEMTYLTTSTTKIRTRLYKVKESFWPIVDIPDFWLPASPEDILLAYSLYIQDPNATGIGANISSDQLSVYPNPANDYFSIDLSNLDQVPISLTITNSLGQITLNYRVEAFADGSLTINCSEWAPGIYLLTLNSHSSSLTTKIIKQ
ncbi:MAG: S8 family serine peptidase [Chitinophagales bacterium]|nr:S8 family serine peptidase [Chitinophagales bacterium]